MSHVSQKISSFPGVAERGSVAHSVNSDLSIHIHSLIEDLQVSTRDARARQLIAEQERDILQSELDEIQQRAAGASDFDAKVERLIKDCDRLAGQLDAAELRYQEAIGQRDELVRKHKEEARGQDSVSEERDQALLEQESTLRQLAAARRDILKSNVKIQELQNHLAEAQKGPTNSKPQSSDVQRQLAMLRQARDAASAQAAELKVRVGDLEDEVANIGYSREVAQKAADQAIAQLEEALQQSEIVPILQKELETLRSAAASASVSPEDGAYRAEVAELRQNLARIAQERDTARARVQERDSELDGMRASLFTARKEASERAGLAEAFEEMRALLELEHEQNASLMQECETFHQQFSDAMPVQTGGEERSSADHNELLQQLESAQLEINELQASLAKARAPKRTKKTPNAAALARKTPDTKPITHVEAGPIDEKTGKAVIADMRSCLADFDSTSPREASHLHALHTHAHAFSEHARGYGQIVLHRISAAFAAYVEGIARVPERATAEVTAKLDAAIGFITGLLAEQDIERTVHLSEARVYMVDDDPESSETVSAALDCVGLKSQSSTYASAAIADLSEACYDLILLDLDLPDLDGFELCAHIRKIPHHAHTPIIFLTGYESDGNRDQCFLSGGNEFLGKPFSVQELGLNALTHIIQAQLHAA